MQALSDDEIKRRLSSNLPKLRGELSLSEIARRCETYPTAIKEVEDGVRMPGVGMLTRICEAIGCTIDEILRPSKNSKKSA